MISTAVLPQLETAASSEQEVPATELLAPHIVGIDVLRGLAILAVIVFHGMAYGAPSLRWGSPVADAIYGLTAWGWLGVNLFFVLSGFLITGILDDTEVKTNFYKRFYIRRALRILPAYVAVLALAWATKFATPGYVAICLLFLANMPGFFLRHGYVLYGPFWSLAVEEQFYLVWPMLYRKLGRRGMLPACLVLLLICPALRALAFAHVIHTGDVLSKTWMVGDNLALGAMLAILVRWPGMTVARFSAMDRIQFCAGMVGLLSLLGAGRMGVNDVLRNSVGLSSFLLLCGSVMVLAVCWSRTRPLPRWMAGFVFLGDISYGLYLIHLLLLQIYDRKFGNGFTHDGRLLLLRFVVVNAAAIGIAAASRRWYEGPILRLKKAITAAR